MSVAQSDLELGAQPNRLTILHITAPAAVGGLERVVEALAAGHARAGHRVHVAAVLGPDDTAPAFLAALKMHGVRVHVLRTTVRGYRAERAFIAALCRDIRPDVVHTHGYRPDVVDGGVARRAGIATVSTVHGFTRGRGRGRLYEWLQRRSYRRFDAVVAVSRPQTSELESAGVPRARLRLLQNAWPGSSSRVDPLVAQSALGLSPVRFHIGWVGRLSEEKGPDVFIEALHLLAVRHQIPFEASVIGDGPAREKLIRTAASLDIGQVHWHGLVNSAARYFEAFDVLVLSSRTEGTPIVLFEAMAARVPIVTTRVGGIPDVLGDEHALLVPAEDASAIADAIVNVFRHPDQARQRADAAAERLADRFDVSEWLSEYESIYAQVRKNP